MSNHSVGTLIDPVLQRRMPLYNENMAPAGLSQSQNVSSFMEKQALQYKRAYFSYEPQGQDRAVFPAPWSSSKSSAVDGSSPVTHLSGTDGLHKIIYKKDNNSEENHPVQQNSPSKQGFTLYTKSPGFSSPQSTASVIVRKTQDGAERVSPERPVYLAVPQAVYRHSPCCTDLCCVMGQRYNVGHGSNTLSNSPYAHTWRTGEPLYSDQVSDTLLQQRQLHTEALGECPKSMSMFSPGRTHSQTYSPTQLKELFGSLSEQNHCLQPSPIAYPGLYPSHPTYEPVIYHNRSPIPKYGQAAQQPGFYYSPVHVEVENRTESRDTDSKHTEEVPVALKHPIQPPEDHCMVAPSLHGDFSLPRVEALPDPSFLTGFDYPSYIVPRLNVNTSPMHATLKYPCAVHSEYIHSGSPKHVHRPVTSLATVYQDKSILHSEHSSPFVRVEKTSPARCTRKSAVLSSTQSQSRYCPSRNGAHEGSPGVRVHVGAQRVAGHVRPPIVAPAHLGLDLRASRPCQVRSYLQHPHVSPTHTALANKSNVQKILYCPPRTAERTDSSSPRPNVLRGPLKRGMSISAAIKIHDDDDDVYVVEPDQKRLKTEMRNTEIIDKDSSPPMPVINNVFSLAPYRAYLQMSRLCLARPPQGPVHSEFRKARIQQPHEDVKHQAVVSKDTESKGPPVKEGMNLNLKRQKHLDESKEPAGVCKDASLDSPRVKLAVKQEQTKQTQQQFVSKGIQLKTQVKVKQEGPEEPPYTCSVVSKDVHLDLLKVKPIEEKTEPQSNKKENIDPTEQDSISEMSVYPEQLKIIKKEPEETDLPDCDPLLEINKCDPGDLDYSVDEKYSLGEGGQKKSLSESATGTLVPNPPPALSASPRPHSKLNFMNIPPQCLKLSTYNIILPEANLPPAVQLSAKSPVQPLPKIQLQMPVRKHFFELHQSLVKLISKSVVATSEDTLRSWLSQMELSNLALGKNQKVSCLFGAKGREACLNEEMKSSLQLVLQRLNEYTAQERCPFPFVVRTGAIFLPMLVVKEVLFPSVPGVLIDQVLQEHRVELRPTTLSEEKTLIQMHKRACSSRLRRLMSLKHLPDIYVDVVNLLYYTCVCQQLGLEVDSSLEAEADESCEGPSSCKSPSVPPPSPLKDSKKLKTKSLLKRRSRIKRSSRRMFLDCLSDEEPQKSSTVESVVKPSQGPSNEHHSSDGTENSWMCPLASEELSTLPGELPGDAGREKSMMQHNFESSVAKQIQDKSNSCSGVILKLRRTFNRKRMSYQPVLDSDRLQLETEQDLSAEQSGESLKPEVTRWKRTSALFSHSLRPLSGYTKRKRHSLLTIKYCPYLSACHSAEQRRRWVLRSAVQRARKAMKIYYPDLVGKTIHHLYEEDDKSEVWYRGQVLRVHKAHPNPLKTMFEVRYDSEPEWKYYLELLIDYKKGWLKIED